MRVCTDSLIFPDDSLKTLEISSRPLDCPPPPRCNLAIAGKAARRKLTLHLEPITRAGEPVRGGGAGGRSSPNESAPTPTCVRDVTYYPARQRACAGKNAFRIPDPFDSIPRPSRRFVLTTIPREFTPGPRCLYLYRLQKERRINLRVLPNFL